MLSIRIASLVRFVGKYARSGYIYKQFETRFSHLLSPRKSVCPRLNFARVSSSNTDEPLSESENKQDTEGKSDKPRASGRSTLNQKLHHRIFSAEEQAENEELIRTYRSNAKNDDTSEQFGVLWKTSGKGARNYKNLKNKQRTDTDDSYDRTSNKFAPEYHHKSQPTDHERDYVNLGKQFTRSMKYRNSPNKFGLLSEKNSLEDRIIESLSSSVGTHEERFSDDEDEADSTKIRLSARNRRHIPEWYGMKIEKLGKRGQIREAIEVFEDWMLEKDRVRPNSYVFTCLIAVLGRAGYTKKAFSYFNMMKKMGIDPPPAVYTSLFNACANSPWKSDGGERATRLLELMKEKDIQPNSITGKAMIKAFALSGDLQRAFALVDELSKLHRPDCETFSFLLMACISDREAGFRHAIQVWRLMLSMRIRPDLPLYNLLIRCIRDCGIGDAASFHTMLTGESTAAKEIGFGESRSGEVKSARTRDRERAEGAISRSVKMLELIPAEEMPSASPQSEHPSSDFETAKETEFDSLTEVTLTGSKLVENDKKLREASTSVTVHAVPVSIPNVLSPAADVSAVTSLTDLSSSDRRLALLGGVDGVLSHMAKDGAAPNVITFSQLISVAMPTLEAEEHLLAIMSTMKVKPDIDLVNALIHKRCMRKDFAAAKEAVTLIKEHGLIANQMTFGVLAMTCKTQMEAADLLEEMESAEMAPNVEIMGTLMKASAMNFFYKLWVLRQMQQLDLQPNHTCLRNIETDLNYARRNIVDAENKDQKSYYLSRKFQRNLEIFTQNYESWLNETQVQRPRHPWDSFRLPPKDQASAV